MKKSSIFYPVFLLLFTISVFYERLDIPISLAIIEVSLVVVELIILTRVILVVASIRKEVREGEDPFIIDTWKHAIEQTFGSNRLINFLVSEILIITYSIVGLFKKLNYKQLEFSYTRKGSTKYLVAVVVVLSLVEIPLIHLILDQFNHTLAWSVTVVSIYGLFWLFGDFQLMRFHPIRLEKETISVRIGIRSKVDVKYHMIDLIEIRKPEREEEVLKLTPDMKVKLLIHLKVVIEVEELFGRKKTASCLGFNVDEIDSFVYHLKKKIRNYYNSTYPISDGVLEDFPDLLTNNT